jgi:SAM-dependent methyltransferase
MIRSLASSISRGSREKRGKVFLEYLRPRPGARILDLGSEDGSHLASILPFRDGIVVADISKEALRVAEEKFGYGTMLIDESGKMPCPDGHFDIVFCNSVIEHVTVDKTDVNRMASGREFAEAAFERQKRFAQEIRRVAKSYFVQTPHKYFPIESHTWMPAFVVFMPRSWLIQTLRVTNKFWPKKTSADWHLLTPGQMRTLFPDAEIIIESIAGLPKSIMAIKR